MSRAELEQQLRAVLDGSLSLDAFEDWLVQTSWDMHKKAAPSMQRVVASIEHAFARLESESEIRAALAQRLDDLAVPPMKPIAPARSSVVQAHASQAASYSRATLKDDERAPTRGHLVTLAVASNLCLEPS